MDSGRRVGAGVIVLRFLKFLTSFVVAALVAALGVAATYGLKWARELPDYRELDNLTRSLGSETKIFARDGAPLGSLIQIGRAHV